MLRSIFSAFQAGIMFVAPDRKISLINDKMTSITGYRLEDIKNEDPRIFYANDEEYARITKLISEKVRGGNVAETDATWVRKDGKIRHVHLSVAPVGPDDLPAGAVCIVTDVTEQKEAEARLVESEERYKSVIENSHDGITLVKNGKLTYVNQRLLEIFGFDKAEDIIGESSSIFVHD